MDIPVVENVLKLNDEIASENRQRLAEAGVACVNLIGSPGCGKTALLERTLPALAQDLAVGLLAGDIATTRDAQRLAKHCPHVTQINTGGSCHLDANQVKQGMRQLPIDELDLLIIENVGNLICPVSFDLGQRATIGMFSVPEGEDKPAKHPRIVLEADLLLLGKMDLLEHVPFDREVFLRDLRSLREDVPLIELSAMTGAGLDRWIAWLTGMCAAAERVV
ncbi:MAG: hydrogenase nickel incorporation protein HypB [Phycisphaerales bacterium JB039]